MKQDGEDVLVVSDMLNPLPPYVGFIVPTPFVTEGTVAPRATVSTYPFSQKAYPGFPTMLHFPCTGAQRS